MSKYSKTEIISTILLIGFCLSSYFHFVVAGSYLNMHYPHNTFLFIPGDKFMDLFNPLDLTKDFDPYINNDKHGNIGNTSNYFPFTYIILYFLTLLPSFVALAILIATFIAATLYLVTFFLAEKESNESRLANIRNIFILSLLSYPFLLMIDRANIEAIVFAFEVIFLICYLKGYTKTAITFISFAAAIKFSPGFLALLFLKDKKFKEFFYCVALTIIISIAATLMLKGGGFMDQIYALLSELKMFNQVYALPEDPNTNGLSIIFLIKLVFGLMNIKSNPENILYYTSIFSGFTYLAIFYYILRFENVLWKNLMLITSANVVLFHVSHDYKLISILLPMMAYIKDETKYKYDYFYAIGFGILMMPKQLVMNIGSLNMIQISNIVNIVTILLFMTLIILEKYQNLSYKKIPKQP